MRTCMSCGSPAAHIVIYPYNQGDANGRLLVYCDQCGKRPGALVVLPVRLLDEDGEGTLQFLYGQGLTLTSPEAVGEMLGVPEGPWTATAERAIRQAGSS